MAHLEIQLPAGKKQLRLKGRPVTLGRHPDNDITLTDDKASRHHCIIEPVADGYRLRDLKSRNGTKLNQDRIETEMLDNGDVVRIGSTELRFIDPAQERSHKRPPAPDPEGSENGSPEDDIIALLARDTIDVDLEPLTAAKPSYEQALAQIIDAASEKPFDENDLNLVDTRGATIHAASARGVKTRKSDEATDAIVAFRLLLLACFRSRATDLHLEPGVDDANVRLRVDGFMVGACSFGTELYRRILGIVKVLCQIDTSQKSTVQDGHFSVSVKGRRVDYRVSMTPAMHGQKLVIRVLDSASAPDRLHELGLLPWMYDKLRVMATRDAGLLLACGPTGSGKTTTLYSCLREIDVERRNAITIEDPVEYSLEGCTQIPIDAKQGSTFATILRSVLRQDPDVIFVGEIRDLETATVAMQAAMTGHLVYSTVHAKDSIGAIFRLLDLGIESYLVANALNMILAQRLVRVLCPNCRKAVKPTPAQNMLLGKATEGLRKIYIPGGCRRCLRTGFIGRHAMFELLEVNTQIRDQILNKPTIHGIRTTADQGLFTTLAQFGYHLVQKGVTCVDEIERVAGSE